MGTPSALYCAMARQLIAEEAQGDTLIQSKKDVTEEVSLRIDSPQVAVIP